MQGGKEAFISKTTEDEPFAFLHYGFKCWRYARFSWVCRELLLAGVAVSGVGGGGGYVGGGLWWRMNPLTNITASHQTLERHARLSSLKPTLPYLCSGVCSLFY